MKSGAVKWGKKYFVFSSSVGLYAKIFPCFKMGFVLHFVVLKGLIAKFFKSSEMGFVLSFFLLKRLNAKFFYVKFGKNLLSIEMNLGGRKALKKDLKLSGNAGNNCRKF